MALGLLGGLGIAQTALGAFNSIMGINSNKQNLAWQREQLESQQNYGREMFEKQNQAENERLALQHQWNVEAAEKSQEYAKEMYNYTNYESQVEHMKNAGLNPALLNGGSGQGGQASAGAKQEAGQVMSPMGIQVALQAQQTAAQTNLINAQAKNVQSQTVRQEMENLIGSSIDLVEKISNIRKSKSDTEKVQNEIKGIQKNMEYIDSQIDVLKKDGLKKEQETELLKFQNGINNLLKNATHWENGKEIDFNQATIEKFFGEISKDIKTWDKESQQALFDKQVLERLQKDISLIVQGKLDELTMSSKDAALKIKQYQRDDFELKQDSAFAAMLDDLGSDGRYGRVLSNLFRALVQVIGK